MVYTCFDIDSCRSITSSSTTNSKIMPSIYGMLLICHVLCQLLNMDFLINSHICSVKSPHFMEEYETSERVHNLPKITELVNSGARIQPRANPNTYFLKH